MIRYRQLSLLLFLSTNLFAANSIWNGHIVNDINQFPFIVSLQNSTPNPPLSPHRCGGSLISNQFVLTAGHCVINPDGSVIAPTELYIKYGSLDISASKGLIAHIETIKLHPGYNYKKSKNGSHIPVNDMAIIKLTAPIDKFSPIQLPNLALHDDYYLPGNIATVAGWGIFKPYSTISKRLREGDEELIADTDVSASPYEEYSLFDKNAMVATKTFNGQSSCYGDSGGPLIFKNNKGEKFIIGIISWATTCGEVNAPNVYARVATEENIRWINVA